MSNTNNDFLLMTEVFEKIPSAVIIVDEFGMITKVNQSALDLLGEVNLEQRRWVEVVSNVFRPRQDDGHEISTRDGRRLQVTTLPLEHGQLIQMTDLTETRALQDKMAHMERLSSLGRMAATLAHQIRTPLSAAMLYAANLGNANLQPVARKRFQEKLVGRLEALEAQISDILMFARSNEQTVTKIDASSLIEQTANNVSALIERNNVQLQTISDDGELPIYGNATALTGALSNLIANAVEAGASKIILKLVEENGYVIFSVANNGPQIPDDLKERIFEPFYTSKSSGTGLGLAVVSAVTKVHQGIINLTSWNEDFATVFSIAIPLRTSEDEANVSIEAIEKATAATQGADAKAIMSMHADNSFNLAISTSDSTAIAQASSAAVVNSSSSIISSSQTVVPHQAQNNNKFSKVESSSIVKDNNYYDSSFTQVEVEIPRSPNVIISHSLENVATLEQNNTTTTDEEIRAMRLAKARENMLKAGANSSQASPVLKEDKKDNLEQNYENAHEEKLQSRSAVGAANAVLAAAVRQNNRR